MTKDAIWNMLTEDPSLGVLCRILVEDDTILEPPVLEDNPTDEIVRRKWLELKRFEYDVINLFHRLEKVLQWNAIVDICNGRGRLLAQRRIPLHIINIYMNNLDKQLDTAGTIGSTQSNADSNDK
ncbi:hypothetical protein vseg_017734 [Gypsophila vaccaria]